MYTKGEWRIRECDEDNAEVVFDDPEPYIAIYTPYGNAKANARLIAQAPRMYAALTRFLESSACSNGCDPEDMSCDTSFARKAIAKVEE